jgi:type II secretory pathway pseudopilin PulG
MLSRLRHVTAEQSASPRGRPTRGFSLIEALFGLVLLAVALMAQVSTTLGEHRRADDLAARSEGLHMLKQFVERMRGDGDWAGLYPRLKALMEQASSPSAGAVRLDDGRESFPPQTYYPDFVTSGPMVGATILVDVPAAPLLTDPLGPAHLREDQTSSRFGLPADLSGDGTIDGDSHDGDYLALPVSITLRWQPNGEASRQMRLDTWIRGTR